MPVIIIVIIKEEGFSAKVINLVENNIFEMLKNSCFGDFLKNACVAFQNMVMFDY